MSTPTTHQRSAKGQNFAQKALTKMLIYFLDGNNRTFYSRDLKKGHKVPNKDLGINRLKKYALGNKQFIQTAVIYDNETGVELFKFKEGYWR